MSAELLIAECWVAENCQAPNVETEAVRLTAVLFDRTPEQVLEAVYNLKGDHRDPIYLSDPCGTGTARMGESQTPGVLRSLARRQERNGR